MGRQVKISIIRAAVAARLAALRRVDYILQSSEASRTIVADETILWAALAGKDAIVKRWIMSSVHKVSDLRALAHEAGITHVHRKTKETLTLELRRLGFNV